MLDSNGVIVALNGAARSLFGPAAAPEVHLRELFADAQEKLAAALKLWASGRQMSPAVFHLRGKTPPLAIRCDGASLHPASGSRPATLLLECIERDRSTASRLFTELGEKVALLEKNLFEQRQREYERLSAIQTAAAMFAHEISNPLNFISTSLQLLEADLREKDVTDRDITATVEGATREIQRLAQLLREFRSFAQPQGFQLTPTALQSMIEEVLAPQRMAYRSAGIELECSFAPLPPVLVDRDKMKQALLNLCKNAAEAMPRGGRLTLRTYGSDNVAVLEIADTGDGPPPGIDIFELFRTSKPGGSGLGLPIVRQIISAHKGTIEYARDPNRRTVFTIRLPLGTGGVQIVSPDNPPATS